MRRARKVLLARPPLQVLEPVPRDLDLPTASGSAQNLPRRQDPNEVLTVRQNVKGPDAAWYRGRETGLGRSHGAAKAHARLCADAHAAYLARPCHVDQLLTVRPPDG